MAVVREVPSKVYRVYRTVGDKKRAEYYFMMPLHKRIAAVLYCWRFMKWNEEEKHSFEADFRKAWSHGLPL